MRFAILVVMAAALAAGMNYDAMAARIAAALRLAPRERVLIRYDRDYFHEIVAPLERRIREAGGVVVGPLSYQESGRLEKLLEETDVYVWLPVRGEVAAAERQALAQWLDRGGARRQIHFHWSDGSILPDGVTRLHSPAFDPIYEAALDINYGVLSRTQDRAIEALRAGTVRVRTPAGTDIQFRVGDRPFNKQDGDASAERMKSARIRIDREIELPAGVLRVAPLEETVHGVIVVREARFGETLADEVQFAIEGGRIHRVVAKGSIGLWAGIPEPSRHFREFALGFNPKLHSPPGSRALAYYGYGAGVVRLSLGDNEELGGMVRGGYARWFFFPDATVEVDGRALVREGKLLSP